jgi:S-adenosylmethionine-diacylglycerol 3-amino-3-carboxypropyl transferase
MKNTRLAEAVHQNRALSVPGLMERLFTLSFRGFVYPQIWEDPEIDIQALRLGPDSRVMTIASGGCNVLNYLTEDPAEVIAVDLNPTHLALTRLKLAALRHLPDYEAFFRFFGEADTKANTAAYDAHVRPHLDRESRRYWEGRGPLRQRRISMFSRNIYRYGQLGRFIGTVHVLAKLHGRDPRRILSARNFEEQRSLFEATLAPLFDKKLVRFLCNLPVSLYGLGIPPAQFEALSSDSGGDMAGLLRARLERLACDFPIEDNYFAWQAFGRGYDREKKQAVPRYLRAENFETLRDRAERVTTRQMTVTEFLEGQDARSLAGYVLLDAQDWMGPETLDALWTEIARTAEPGARVVFRTAGAESPLEPAVHPETMALFRRETALSTELTPRDRSSIYGGFHVYTRLD